MSWNIAVPSDALCEPLRAQFHDCGEIGDVEGRADAVLLEAAGVQFDRIANYAPAWKLESAGSFGV